MSTEALSSASRPARDYSLVGESTRRAIETGLASAEWYHTDVPRKTMKELMQRRDGSPVWTRIVGHAIDASDRARGSCSRMATTTCPNGECTTR